MKVRCLEGETWKSASNGHVFIAYQTEESGYHGRSFEDAFFSLNKDLLNLGNDRFPSLTKTSLTKKWYDKYIVGEVNPMQFAEKAVKSKPSLAIEILLNSKEDGEGYAYSNWKTPAYIEEGLKCRSGCGGISMTELTTETQLILDLAREKHCFLLSGGAGSGKTYTLVEAIRAMTQLEPSNRIAEMASCHMTKC